MKTKNTKMREENFVSDFALVEINPTIILDSKEKKTTEEKKEDLKNQDSALWI